MSEKVNHPPHHNQLPVECIDVVEYFDFCIGSAIKYLWRAGLKDGETDLDDYRKAIWYIQRKITKLEKERALAEELQVNDEYMREAFGQDSIHGDTEPHYCNIKRHF